ncbi:MAG: tetratricopeptide repeat protein [Asgard group archaeon]|nr:tetratricopeptide repeat protein [Asgard group archaeon]
MSFDAKDIIPIEYQSLFQIISPIEKSGILKVLKENYGELKKYEALFLALKQYLTDFKDEDISALVFIMYGQICMDLQKEPEIPKMLEVYPNSPELQFYNIQLEVDKGIFDSIDDVLAKTRLTDENRNMILTRLVAADKLASMILDLQSFLLENMFHAMKEQYDKITEVSIKAEEVLRRAVEWTKEKDITFLHEIAIRLILQKTQILMSSRGLDAAINYYEKPANVEIIELAKSNIMKANVAHVAAMLYYSAGDPNKGLKYMEKAIKILKKIHGRYSWKSSFYHNYGYMLTLVDTDKCIEVYEEGLALLEETQDYQSMASNISNLIGLYTQQNKKTEARKYLKRLVEIISMSAELITPFRAYAVASNAMSLDDYDLARKFLEILEKKVEQSPTLMNQAILAGAKMGYYLDVEINSEKAYKYGEESLYFFNKQKDYLNALASIYNLVNTDFQFYKITEKERYLSSARKRLNELFTLVGALDQPEWVADKNTILAGFEYLNKNYKQAKTYIDEIPVLDTPKIKANRAMMTQLIEFAIERTKEREEGEEEKKLTFDNAILNELANNIDAMNNMVMHLVDKTLEEIVALPQQVDPVKADIKLILLINSAGLTIYTKIFDTQKMNQQLISNFISAIDSFGKQLFGTKEPYFSFSRGNNIILFQNVNDDLNLALIVSQENYDSIMKLNTLSKELSEYLLDKPSDLNKSIDEKSDMYDWLEKKVEDLTK